MRSIFSLAQQNFSTPFPAALFERPEAFASKHSSITFKVVEPPMLQLPQDEQTMDNVPMETVENEVSDDDQPVSSGPADQAIGTKENTLVSGANDENVVTHIIETLERQCTAWNEGDIKTYMNGYAEDAIYISRSLLKTQTNASTRKENDICLHGRIAIETLFEDVLDRSLKQTGKLSYRQLQVQYATAERAFVMGRYEFSISKEQKVVDEGVFTLDMACTLEAGDHGARQWKIKTEHASSAKRK